MVLLPVQKSVDMNQPEIKFNGTGGFISRVVPDGQIRMLQRLGDGDAFVGIKGQEFRKEVQTRGVGLGVELRKGGAGLVGETAEVVLGL